MTIIKSNAAQVVKARPGTQGFLGTHNTISSPADLAAAIACDSALFETSYYQITELTTPMSKAAFDAQWGPVVQLLGTNQLLGTTGAAGQSTSTNMLQSASLNCNFFLKAVRIVLIAQPEQWALTGMAFEPPPNNEQGNNSGVFSRIQNVQNATPATFEYGKNVLVAIRALLEVMDFEFSVGCDYPLIQTSLARVGCVQLDAATASSGSPNTHVMQKIRDGNRQVALAGITTKYFQPQNTIGGEASNAPLVPGGLGGSINSISCNNEGWMDVRGGMGIVIPANQGIQATLTQNVGNSKFFDSFEQEMTMSGVAVTPTDTMSSAIVGIAGSDAGVLAFKYGLFKYGLELRGAKIRNAECFSWAAQNGYTLGKPYFDSTAWDSLAGSQEFVQGLNQAGGKRYRTLGEAVESSGDKLDPPGSRPATRRDGRSHQSVHPFLLFFSQTR